MAKQKKKKGPAKKAPKIRLSKTSRDKLVKVFAEVREEIARKRRYFKRIS